MLTHKKKFANHKIGGSFSVYFLFRIFNRIHSNTYTLTHRSQMSSFIEKCTHVRPRDGSLTQRSSRYSKILRIHDLVSDPTLKSSRRRPKYLFSATYHKLYFCINNTGLNILCIFRYNVYRP